MGGTEKVGCFMGSLDETAMQRGPERDSIEFRASSYFLLGHFLTQINGLFDYLALRGTGSN